MSKLDQANSKMSAIFKRAHDDGDYFPTEFDTDANDVSRGIIAAYLEQRGQVWLGKINLYGSERKKTDHILQQYTGGIIYTFGCSFIVPVYDKELVALIHERDIAPYTGTKQDMIYLNAITDRIYEIGGQFVHWV